MGCIHSKNNDNILILDNTVHKNYFIKNFKYKNNFITNKFKTINDDDEEYGINFVL